jgi:dUTP pyrophosphatase
MQYQTRLSAGLDLCSTILLDIAPSERVVVDTGVYLQDVMPVNMTVSINKFRPLDAYVPCAMVCSRSGLAAKEGIIVLNAPGIVDADYEDTIKVVLFNTSDRLVRLHEGARIAQLVFTYAYRRLELVKDEDRQGGLGSTGGGTGA